MYYRLTHVAALAAASPVTAIDKPISQSGIFQIGTTNAHTKII